MNLQELEKNAADLRAKLDEMKATITKMKYNKDKTGFFKPEIGDAYRTIAEAERARNKQEVTQRLRELAGGYRFKAGADNWHLFYSTDTKDWVVAYSWTSLQIGQIYFKTIEAAFAARDELGSRLNVLLEIEE